MEKKIGGGERMKITLKALRVNAGYTIEQVSSQTRHSNINTTQQYLKTEKEGMMSLANKL